MKKEIEMILNELRPEFDFGDSDDFITDGLLDSFDIISLVSSLEERFECTVDGLDIIPENFSSLEAIEELVNKSKK